MDILQTWLGFRIRKRISAIKKGHKIKSFSKISALRSYTE